MKIFIFFFLVLNLAYAQESFEGKKCPEVLDTYENSEQKGQMDFERSAYTAIQSECPSYFPRSMNLGANITDQCTRSQMVGENTNFTVQSANDRILTCMNQEYANRFNAMAESNQLCSAEVETPGEERICKCDGSSGNQKCHCLATPTKEGEVYTAKATILMLDSMLIGPESSETLMVFLDGRDSIVNEEMNFASENRVLQRGYQRYFRKEFSEQVIDPQFIQIRSNRTILVEGSSVKELGAVRQDACRFERISCRVKNYGILERLSGVERDIDIKTGNGYLYSDDQSVVISESSYSTLEVVKDGNTYECGNDDTLARVNAPSVFDGEIDEAQGEEPTEANTTSSSVNEL